MKRIFALLLAMCLLCGCAAAPVPAEPTETTAEPTEEAAAPTSDPTEEPTLPPTEEPAEAPTEPEIIRSPLTGEILEEKTELRPYAVSVNNIYQAMPQSGISKADILCEVLAEGGITRCIAIYGELSDVGVIGPVRSARPYFLSTARAFDAILAHAGSSEETDELFASTGWNHIDALLGSAADVYYRDQQRLDDGYALEHTLYTTGEKLTENAASRGFALAREGGVSYGFSFTEDGTPAEGEEAASITVTFNDSGNRKKTILAYDADLGKYTGSQYGSPWMDEAAGTAVSFENVLIITAETRHSDNKGHLAIDLIDEGSGWFACGGKIIPIRWSRESESDPFVFTLTDGTPLCLGVGSTYFGIITQTSEVAYQ